MDIALAVEKLLYGAAYRGSVVTNTPECWEAVKWQDPRIPKPIWAELEAAWAELQTTASVAEQVASIKTQLDQLDQFAIRPLCTILAASDTDDITDDLHLIARIEEQKVALRQQLAELEASTT